MLLSIVIRTLNESRYLEELLVAARRQQIGEDELEIVVIDSGSTDNTVEIAEKYGCCIAHIDRDQFSFGRSLNMGAEFANGDVLIFISGHCIPCDDHWISNLTEPLRLEKAGYVYGRQLGRDTTKYSESKLLEKYFPNFSHNPQPEFFCNNANAAILTETWRRFLFDETLTGLEDMELAKRLCESGGRVAYVASAGVYHIHDETWSQTKRRYEREAIALQKIMPEVQISLTDFVRYFSSAIALDTSTALAERCLFREIADIFRFRFAQYYGGYRGNHEHRKLSQQKKDRFFYPRRAKGQDE